MTGRDKAGATGQQPDRKICMLWILPLLSLWSCRCASGQKQESFPDAPSTVLNLRASEDDGQQAGSGAAQKPSQAAATGTITGTVIDGEANVMAGVEVTLLRDGAASASKTTTDSNGSFRFGGVPAGKFRITATTKGMSPASFYGVLKPGESLQTLPLRLQIGAIDSTVDVVASPEELAEAEIHVEEHQRVLGVVPNFYTAYDWNAPPLTTRQKFELAWKNVIDPGSFFITGFIAGVEQADGGFSGYGQGAAGYGRRYGAASGDLISGTYLGGAILPTLFHQDPRYFYRGIGTVKQRTLYAITRAFLCRGDNGKVEVNYSGILGDLAAGALSNTYYPASNRQGAALTFEEGGLNILGDAAGNIVQEFALKHLTPHAPNYASTTKPAPDNGSGSVQP